MSGVSKNTPGNRVLALPTYTWNLKSIEEERRSPLGILILVD